MSSPGRALATGPSLTYSSFETDLVICLCPKTVP